MAPETSIADQSLKDLSSYQGPSLRFSGDAINYGHKPGWSEAQSGLQGTQSIPVMRRLDKSAIMRWADQYLVHAHTRRHAGDEGDGAAAIFRLQHFGLLLL